VITRSGRLPVQAHLFTDAHRDRTLIMTGEPLPDATAPTQQINDWFIEPLLPTTTFEPAQ
jgi:hypothetical protein